MVLFHTGHSKLWKKYNEEYNKGCPGPGKTVANWLADKKIMVVGADTWPVEAVPGEDANRPFECHSIWLTMNGIYINENLNLDGLVKDRVYEFAWSFNPLALKGAVGVAGELGRSRLTSTLRSAGPARAPPLRGRNCVLP